VGVSGGAGATGISGALTAGLLFGRLSTVQLRGEVSLFQNFFREDRDFDGTGGGTHNTGIVFSGGIGF
jgi:hypothetical protein